jgi:hypothetical protein
MGQGSGVSSYESRITFSRPFVIVKLVTAALVTAALVTAALITA